MNPTNQKTYCAYCGEELEPLLTYCPNCGMDNGPDDEKTNITQPTVIDHNDFCYRCKAPLEKDQPICPRCAANNSPNLSKIDFYDANASKTTKRWVLVYSITLVLSIAFSLIGIILYTRQENAGQGNAGLAILGIIEVILFGIGFLGIYPTPNWKITLYVTILSGLSFLLDASGGLGVFFCIMTTVYLRKFEKEYKLYLQHQKTNSSGASHSPH